MTMRTIAIGLVFLGTACAPRDTSNHSVGGDTLGGTAWQLVQFEGGDGTVLTPDDRSKYTIAFGIDSSVSVRIDCNRGRGTWTATPPSALEFGPLALTRAACPPGSLHDQIVRQWPYIRSYIIKDGHLYVSLMADGGIYEFEPLTPEASRGIPSSATTGAVASAAIRARVG